MLRNRSSFDGSTLLANFAKILKKLSFLGCNYLSINTTFLNLFLFYTLHEIFSEPK